LIPNSYLIPNSLEQAHIFWKWFQIDLKMVLIPIKLDIVCDQLKIVPNRIEIISKKWNWYLPEMELFLTHRNQDFQNGNFD